MTTQVSRSSHHPKRLAAMVMATGAALFSLQPLMAKAELQIGSDLNSATGTNTAINALYSANRGTNGGGDQSLQFGDVQQGSAADDVLIGGLGMDVQFGGAGNDVLIGGTEDFNPLNRDVAFGEAGDDVFIWAPGDGNDFFDGGEGIDVLMLGLIGENRNSSGQTEGAPFFAASPAGTAGTGDFDGIFLTARGLPVVEVANGPGFCEIIDAATEAQGLKELGLDQLVRFFLRTPHNAFVTATTADPSLDPNTLDTGLRIAMHVKNVEFLVCGGKAANTLQVFDLTRTPAVEVDLSQLPPLARELLRVSL